MKDQFADRLRGLFVRPQIPDRYPGYDLAQAQQRLLGRRSAGTRPPGPRGRTPRALADLPEPGPETAAPVPGRATWPDPRLDHPADADEARRALNTAALRTVFGADSGDLLHSLVVRGPGDPGGVLVYACLLHLLGHEGAPFWWRFAAGAGSRPAAYCLFLDHSRHGEYGDAGHWAQELATGVFDPLRRWGRYGEAKARRPLPPTLLAHVREYEDELLGPVPAPAPALPAAVREIVEPQIPPYVAARAAGPGEGADPGTAAGPARPSATVRSAPCGPRAEPAPAAEHSDALRQARTAEQVVQVLARHPLGVTFGQLRRESELPGGQLTGIVQMLVEEEFATRVDGRRVYAPGPALQRLGVTGGTNRQLQHTLALARDSVGAAVYLSRYHDGEVHITQMADGPVTPAVHEWVDFRSAAHASAVGKCLLTQLDRGRRADHLVRHRAARLTRRTITSPRVLLDRLDRITLNDPVFDLREYSPHTVCAAVPITVGAGAGSLALSLPHGSAHRLRDATRALTAKAVPVLLTLLLAGAKLPGQGPPAEPGPAGGAGPGRPPAEPAAPADRRISPAAFDRMRRTFRTPLVTAGAIRQAAFAVSPGPHLATEAAGDALYLFAPDPAPGPGEPALALPHTYTAVRLPDPPGLAGPGACAAFPPDGLLVFRT